MPPTFTPTPPGTGNPPVEGGIETPTPPPPVTLGVGIVIWAPGEPVAAPPPVVMPDVTPEIMLEFEFELVFEPEDDTDGRIEATPLPLITAGLDTLTPSMITGRY